MQIFERLRQKPSHIKAQYAFISASIVTLVIGLVWFSTMPARFSQVETTPDSTDSFETDTPGLNELLGDTKDQLGNLVNWEDSLVEPIGTTESGVDASPRALDEGSALGSLGTRNEATEESVSLYDVIIKQEPEETREESVIIETVPAEKETQFQGPRVILIGTTTSQNRQ